MKTYITILGTVLILVSATSALAQLEGHRMPGGETTTTAGETAGTCAQETTQALSLIEQTQAQLDAARETNSAQALRTAVDDAQAALADMKVKFTACQGTTPSQVNAPGRMPSQTSHAEHQMPGMSMPGSGGAMDHSTMDHAKMGPTMSPDASSSADRMCPVSRMAGSERHIAEFQGKMYYFCSEVDRQKFLAHPQKYVGQEKQSQ
jgi:YHS domain-containing protein